MHERFTHLPYSSTRSKSVYRQTDRYDCITLTADMGNKKLGDNNDDLMMRSEGHAAKKHVF